MYLLVISSVSLDLLLDDRSLDTLVRGDRDERGVTLTDDEDVVKAGGELLTDGILNVDDLVASVMLLSALNDTDATQVVSAGDHAEVSNIELDGVGDLAGGEVDLDGIVDLDVRVGVADGATVVGDQARNALGTNVYALDLAKLVLYKENRARADSEIGWCMGSRNKRTQQQETVQRLYTYISLLSLDAVDGEASLGIVEETEELLGGGDGDDI
jgi:hypothetical protein